MALPWLIGLGVAALVAAVVISTLSDFFDKVDDVKEEYDALEAEIQSKLSTGDHKTIKIGLRDYDGRLIRTEKIEVSNDVADELYIGQTI